SGLWSKKLPPQRDALRRGGRKPIRRGGRIEPQPDVVAALAAGGEEVAFAAADLDDPFAAQTEPLDHLADQRVGEGGEGRRKALLLFVRRVVPDQRRIEKQVLDETAGRA